MRADEFIASTPKFLSIYDALGIPPPTFVSLPPILREDRTKKLGKRDGAKDILDYRTEGYLADAMINFLALTGWNPGTDQEFFERDELIAAFDISRIQRGGAVVNDDKLQWLNKLHLAKLSHHDFLSYLKESTCDHPLLSTDHTSTLHQLVPTIRERISVRTEFETALLAGEYDFAISQPSYDRALLQWKKDTDVTAGLPRLEHLVTLLSQITTWDNETLMSTVMPYAEEVGKGEVLWPLRVALSGRAQSPDPFTIMVTIGQAATLDRLAVACAKIRGNATT
jgi:glutamyl/glutaminyl-tRNA synthetase